MACATLKRSLDFDPVHHQRPTKRQRCVPMCVSPSSSPPTTSQECRSSPFGEVSPKLTPEIMAARVREEIRRLHRRKQLHFNPNHDSNSNDSTDCVTDAPGSPSSSFATAQATSHPDKPLFTLSQVGLICERMIQDREIQIREEYDRILYQKLSEQYEAFVKFSNDQLQRRFEVAAAPSYLS
ncbi:unnamed protein product [Bemisia tabaci]|uniref:Akirin n=1 Tax=Bemisia tabaci TaxID=7038 RepID=A0A9P0F0P4_BEMTA|nr:PREDICTED: akirin-like [Bemisia tabaci]CAH0386951.1 unnamed protein product [Bemisia tabaci]